MKGCNLRLRTLMSGVTLVELMIAMTLGLVLSIVLANIFVSNARTRAEIDSSGRQIENGRYAMRVLLDELSNAGFFAGAELSGARTQNDFCDATEEDLEANEYILAPFVDVITSSVSCTPGFKSGTQAIAVRRLSTDGEATALQADCPVDLTCVQVASDGTPNFSSGAQGEKLATEEFAPVRVPITHVYYVDQNDTLRRASLMWSGGAPSMPSKISDTEPIADGVERLAFTRTPNNTNPTAVRIELLVRSPDPTPGFTDSKTYVIGGDEYKPSDGYRRQYYAATAPLYNPVNVP